MIVISILATLASMAVPMYKYARDDAKEMVAVGTINQLQQGIDTYYLLNGVLPASLDELPGFANQLDPWGNPYQYLAFDSAGNGNGGGNGGGGNGEKRKDRFLVPINSTYDLYSMGPDGKSVSPLTAASSRDDIIRANDGEYVGPASGF